MYIVVLPLILLLFLYIQIIQWILYRREKLMQLLVFFTGEVKQYSHRTARVGDAFYNCDQDSPELEWFEKELAQRAGVRRDNHTVYEITKDGKKVYVQFSDRKVMFGLSIVLGEF